MDAIDRQRITLNHQYLCKNISDVDRVMDQLFQNKILTMDELQRVRYKPCTSDQIQILLKILMKHPKGYCGLHQALIAKQMDFIAQTLDSTCINEEELLKDNIKLDELIKTVLREKFCETKGEVVYLGSIVEELMRTFRDDGEDYYIHDDYIKCKIKDLFPKSEEHDDAKKGSLFKNLQRICVSAGKKGLDSEEKTREGILKTKSFINSTVRKAPYKPLIELSAASRYAAHEVPTETSRILLDGNITGKEFKEMELEQIENLFPNYTNNEKDSILFLKNDVLEEEDMKKNEKIELRHISDDEKSVDHYLETFRKFDKETSAGYRKDAILQSSMIRPGNPLEPVHLFSSICSGEEDMYYTISIECVQFAAACLNERTNGTIHFGLQSYSEEFYLEGEVKGIPLSRSECIENINNTIFNQFYSDQLDSVFKCIRPPQFVDVIPFHKTRLSVLEIDIVPESTLMGDEVFFVKVKNENVPKLYRFTHTGIRPYHITDADVRDYICKKLPMIQKHRQEEETKNKTSSFRADLRIKIKDLLHAENDRLKKSYVYPLVFLSHLGSDIDLENLEFLTDLGFFAFFDFSYLTKKSNILEYLKNDKSCTLDVCMVDHFDKENTDTLQKSMQMINCEEAGSRKWIHCNGESEISPGPMNKREWKQTYSIGFKEAVRFYRQLIPKGRALVIFLLFSKEYEILLEAAEDVITSFTDQWMVIAETDEVTEQWFSELLRRDTVDKKEIKERSVTGMSWRHVNVTILELSTGPSSFKCVIPLSNGGLCSLSEEKRHAFRDIDILSINECEDHEMSANQDKLNEIERQHADSFYRGRGISWWNFWFEDHVLKRNIHRELDKKLQEALSRKERTVDNIIEVIKIYHQPGVGGSTTAMKCLWERKEIHKCCIVKEFTERTIDNILNLRDFEEETDDPKPPIVLIDDFDDDKLESLLSSFRSKTSFERDQSGDRYAFCVLLLCIRKAIIPLSPNPTRYASVNLRHWLYPNELIWFQKKAKYLEGQFQNKDWPEPKVLISFNILKENFNPDYIRRMAVDFVNAVNNEKEKNLLMFVSMLNTYDPNYKALPASAFDPIMMSHAKGKKVILQAGIVDRNSSKKTTWDNNITEPLQILLNNKTETKAGKGKQLTGISVINSLFAKQIFSCFQENQSTSAIFLEFLNSDIFKTRNMAIQEVLLVVERILTKRLPNEYSQKDKYAYVVMKILKEEDVKNAADVLTCALQVTQSARVCQEIARLHINSRKLKLAATYAKQATDINPNDSNIWDTYAQVYKIQLTEISEKTTPVDKSNIEEVIEMAKEGMKLFAKEQILNRKRTSGDFGKLRIINLLLQILSRFELFADMHVFHKYLTEKKYVPNELIFLDVESETFLKRLKREYNATVQSIKEKLQYPKQETKLNSFMLKQLEEIDMTTGRFFSTECYQEPNWYPEQPDHTGLVQIEDTIVEDVDMDMDY
ncbi:sterile alpha motif domain-containing protein 9-like [Mytilus californianus]|uniref:sterile alpha motif domain-containing protein 9-like n=1 Tax=Mytilus californianus TaxID=6549 RepID=UPI002247872C|nr:sterile alpha motif domain-containing protein 9-like [Mytilus californianus]